MCAGSRAREGAEHSGAAEQGALPGPGPAQPRQVLAGLGAGSAVPRGSGGCGAGRSRTMQLRQAQPPAASGAALQNKATSKLQSITETMC